MERSIYFDNAATTPMDGRVKEAMEPYMKDSYGNPSSMHFAGRKAREAVDASRLQVAGLINANPEEIIFTASGTESNNMALIGLIEACGIVGSHIITSAIEHPAITETSRYLVSKGASITYLRPGSDGIVRPEAVANAIRSNTKLVSVMAANNVTGVLQPVEEIADIVKRHDIIFHTDAVQAVGKIPLNVKDHKIDLLSMSAHKIYGPKGIGALYVRKGVRIKPLVHGGGQENGLRSATLNVPGIVGMGRAAEIVRFDMAMETARLVRLRYKIMEAICEYFQNVYLIGHEYKRLPGHICLGFAGMEGLGIKLLLDLDHHGIAVSSGSACSSHKGDEPSHVLTAMGMDPIAARSSLRITLGRFNTADEVDEFMRLLLKVLQPRNTVRKRGSSVKITETQTAGNVY
ncbi:MAG: Cysteine desulfurase IscS [Syntrophus sp. SKADARSKE-3]|nr:Cysteine desulfurase IscS [Syntrophus sp. SKADARSKE-3]